jgi:hypothetical protein
MKPMIEVKNHFFLEFIDGCTAAQVALHGYDYFDESNIQSTFMGLIQATFVTAILSLILYLLNCTRCAAALGVTTFSTLLSAFFIRGFKEIRIGGILMLITSFMSTLGFLDLISSKSSNKDQ